MNDKKKITKEYKIAAISSNQQSFGHTGHVMIARDGQAIQGLRINGPWQTPPSLTKGTVLTFEVNEKGKPNKGMEHGFELFNEPPMGQPPQHVVDEVWKPDYR